MVYNNKLPKELKSFRGHFKRVCKEGIPLDGTCSSIYCKYCIGCSRYNNGIPCTLNGFSPMMEGNIIYVERESMNYYFNTWLNKNKVGNDIQ